MESMLALVFGGRIVFVKNHADDAKATEELKTRKVIGLDCEWVPDFKPGADAPLSIVQVCDGDSCYLWLLYQYRGHPKGLHSLITDPSITKVGCGMRGSDLNKFARSNLAVGPGYSVPGANKLRYDLPEHFEDIQDYKTGDKKDQKAPYLGLDHLGAFYLQRRPPVTVKSTNAKWRFIEMRSRTLFYAITDAYATFLIYLVHHENLDLVKALLDRDDETMREFVSDHLNEEIPANQKVARAIKLVGAFKFDSRPSNPLSEVEQRQHHLHRQYFAARVIVEAEELKLNPNTTAPSKVAGGRPPAQEAHHNGPNHQNHQQQAKQRQPRQNNAPQNAQPNANGQHSNQRRPMQRRGSLNGTNANNGNHASNGNTSTNKNANGNRQMPAVPPPPSRQVSALPSAEPHVQVAENALPSNDAPQQAQRSQQQAQQRQQKRPNNGNAQNRGPRPQQAQNQQRKPNNPPKATAAAPTNDAPVETANGAPPQAEQDSSKNGGQRSGRAPNHGRHPNNNKPKKVDGEGKKPQQQRRGENNKAPKNNDGRAQAQEASSSSAPH